MLAVDVGAGGESSTARPRPLFKGPYMTGGAGIGGGAGVNFDIAMDGQHFAMILPSEPESVHDVALVQNWTEELKRLVPAR